MAAAIAWWVIAIQPEGEAKHADNVEVPGYEQIYRSTVGDGDIEMAFAGPLDDRISQKDLRAGVEDLLGDQRKWANAIRLGGLREIR